VRCSRLRPAGLGQRPHHLDFVTVGAVSGSRTRRGLSTSPTGFDASLAWPRSSASPSRRVKQQPTATTGAGQESESQRCYKVRSIACNRVPTANGANRRGSIRADPILRAVTTPTSAAPRCRHCGPGGRTVPSGPASSGSGVARQSDGRRGWRTCPKTTWRSRPGCPHRKRNVRPRGRPGRRNLGGVEPRPAGLIMCEPPQAQVSSATRTPQKSTLFG
jgi:hypothetical protein